MISYWTILLRLVAALLLGSIVGLERERKERGAGMRTLALVTLGSTLFTLVSAYGFLDLIGQLHLTLDPTRIASYIVAGVGFLGAGTIFMSRDREKVKGLTTAATIWVMAAVGIACGAGLLLEAISTTLLTLIVLVVLSYVEKRLAPTGSANAQHIRIEASMVNGELLSKVYETGARYGLVIEKLRIHSVEGADVIELSCRAVEASSIANALGALRALPGVHLIQIDEMDAGEISNFLNKGKREV
ncbi:MAG TPA: MgtC/SapB family protein [Ktedonobacteraceae bacterium]|nr:MgtC/SapB family protein [Ktedonobacteraceae bacterium]